MLTKILCETYSNSQFFSSEYSIFFGPKERGPAPLDLPRAPHNRYPALVDTKPNLTSNYAFTATSFDDIGRAELGRESM